MSSEKANDVVANHLLLTMIIADRNERMPTRIGFLLDLESYILESDKIENEMLLSVKNDDWEYIHSIYLTRHLYSKVKPLYKNLRKITRMLNILIEEIQVYNIPIATKLYDISMRFREVIDELLDYSKKLEEELTNRYYISIND